MHGFLAADFFRFAQALFTKLSTLWASGVLPQAKYRSRFSRVADRSFVNPRLTPRPRRQALAEMDQIESIYASFFGPRAALIHKFCSCQDSEKINQKIFLLIRAQAKSLILLEQAGCVPDEQFVAARMKSRFWHVKPQLRTKLSTQIVDSSKKAFCDDHLKKLLKNYVKNLAQVSPDVLARGWRVLADARRSIRPQSWQAGLVQAWLSDCQRWVA